MRHNKKSEKFSRSTAQRKALVKSLLRALVVSEKIKTTESKAKALRSHMDKLITWGKSGSLHSKRLSYSLLGDHKLVKKLFDVIAPRFKDINGGYTRVINVGFRKGDGAKLSFIELTRRPEIKKKKAAKKAKAEITEETPKKTVKEEKSKSEQEQQTQGFMSGMKKIFKKEKKGK